MEWTGSWPAAATDQRLEHEAQDSGLDVDVRFTDTSGWYSNDRIVGAHLFAAGYAELANTISLAMRHGLTTRQVKSTTVTYLSIGSDLGSII